MKPEPFIITSLLRGDTADKSQFIQFHLSIYKLERNKSPDFHNKSLQYSLIQCVFVDLYEKKVLFLKMHLVAPSEGNVPAQCSVIW